ncbi:MAG: sulfite reductase subunit A [Alphaproteobacteria bacterium]|nr:sulfite reductase subunit A [Alphaproteobacteria bacterium]
MRGWCRFKRSTHGDSTLRVIDAAAGLEMLLDGLRDAGYGLIGPMRRDGAIVFDEIDGVADLPRGWTDEQEGGRYRLRERSDGAFFGFAHGPESLKRHLHVPHQELWRAERRDGGLDIVQVAPEAPRRAFIGARACDIHAVAIQDRVLTGGAYADPHYAARRRDVFIVAVNCGEPGGTCFCASMDAGPRATGGFDIALTELMDGGRHDLLLEPGSEAGRALLATLPAREASEADRKAAAAVTDTANRKMGRRLDAARAREMLSRVPEHPRWEEVADRCLSCGNCTQVCPTCFCTTEVDSSDLAVSTASRARQWDSCFTLDFSMLHGGPVRHSTRARYRQWMTHKLATWHEQFGTAGCVGCGRCITWCPVGIDITEETAAMTAREETP